MLIVIMYAVLLGPCYGGSLKNMRSSQYIIDISQLLRPGSDKEYRYTQDGMVPGNSTERDGMVSAVTTRTDGMVQQNVTGRSGLVSENNSETDGMVPENDSQTDGMVPENYTENYQITRHMSRRRLKSLKKKYKRKCILANSVECGRLFFKIVHAESGVRGKFGLRNLNIDFRMCFNGEHIVYFDTKTQICCDGVFNKTSDSEECCNGAIIDNREQFCCSGQVQNRTEFSECCGTYTYDNRTHTCCNGNLFSKLQGSKCCGDEAYNEEHHDCCFETFIFSRSQGDKCCGTKVYNSSTHTCCETNIQPIYGKKNNKGECCKDRSFHRECFKCENGVIIPVFNESSEVCCEGKIRVRKYGNNTGCCWRQVMHTGTQQCQNRQIINMPTQTQSVTRTFTEQKTILLVSEDDDDFEDYMYMYNEKTSDSDSDNTKIVIVLVAVGACTMAVGVVAFVCVCRMSKRQRKQLEAKDAELPKFSTEYDPNDGLLLNNTNYSLGINYQRDDINRNTLRSLADSPEIQIPSKNFSLQFYSSNANAVANITKSDAIPKENVLANHYKHSYTQTCPEKESNRRTVFGKPFEHNFILGMSNGTAKMPDSEVKMTLPQSLLRQNQVEVNCTSFRTISPLRKKLGLSDDETIASPVVEYALTGYGNLPDYAVVVLPFVGSPGDLKVRKFRSDEGLSTVVSWIDVPVQGKTNEDVDAFYIIKDFEVYIYTKSFSGFYCTTCRHRPLSLRCFLFGSYKRFTNPLRHEVRVMIYLADDLMKFADYKERMFTNENAEGRVLKKEMQLRLPTELTETDLIQASVTPTESHYTQWIHKLYPGDSSPIYDEIQTVQIENVAEKCKNCEFCHLPEHDIPHCIEWYLTNADGVIPNYTFQCIVDVDVIRAANGATTSNRIVIDELQLRQEDRYPIEEQFNARNVQGLKEYLSGAMSADKRDAVLGALLSKYSCTGRSVEEVFFKLQEKLTPKYLLEAVATVMKEKHMFTELDVLQAYGIFPQHFISSDVQPVCQAVQDDVGQVGEPSHIPAQQSYLNEHNANGVESQDIAQPVENMYTRPVVQVRSNDNRHDKDTLRLVTNKSADTLSDHRNVRPELSYRQGITRPELSFKQETNVSKSLENLTLTGASVVHVRGEVTTPAIDSRSREESQTLHAQECASLDETHLKQTLTRTKSKD